MLSLFFRFYSGITFLLIPFIKYKIKKRIALGKEDPYRYTEKFSIIKQKKFNKKTIWIHAASVGESLSILSLVGKFLQDDFSVLVTTSTYSSGKIMKKRLPKGAIHQYAPLDVGIWINKFLSYWDPVIAIRVDSEIWPNTLNILKKRKIKSILINARVSKKSYNNWKKYKKLISYMISSFDLIFVQAEEYVKIFKEFTKNKINYMGNLKYSLKPVKNNNTDKLKIAFKKREVFLCAVTHPSDYKILFESFLEIKKNIPNVLFIIVPRHIEKINFIFNYSADYNVKLYSEIEKIDKEIDVIVGDTIGNMQMWYSLSNICFIGGSFCKEHSGQSPIEAMYFENIIIQGPYTENFPEITKTLKMNNSSMVVNDAKELANCVIKGIKDKSLYEKNVKINNDILKKERKKVSAIYSEVLKLC